MRNTRAKTIVRDSDPKQQDQPINQDKAEIADEELHGVTGGSLGGNATIQKKHIAGVKYE
jgi:hypothetical protein